MAIYRLTDDFEEDNEFTLLALHSFMEDYRVAYFLNRYLGTRFVKVKPVEISSEKVFQNYEWMDKKNDVQWNVLQNVSAVTKVSESTNEGSLFNGFDESKKVYLLPEHKKVDFFLKINAKEEFLNIQKTIRHIQQIPNIVSTYKLAASNLKTTTNLIF